MTISSFAILTSGGDAPGMNAAIRAAARCGLAAGMKVWGVREGYAGLMEGRFEALGTRSVAGILHRAGTMLGSARARGFETEEGRAAAAKHMRDAGIDALIVIGGNGSQAGSKAFADQSGIPVVGIASTIDNDLFGSEATLGVDSALHVILQAIDQLKVTASSHRRASIIEVMGRDCGYLALMAGVAGGAETIVVPEAEVGVDEIVQQIREAFGRGKSHALVVVAEGASSNARALQAHFRSVRGDDPSNADALGFAYRITVLGHVQRGGNPTPFDRMLGTRLGADAVAALNAGESKCLCAWVDGKVKRLALDEVVGRTKVLPSELLELGRVLAQ